MKEDNIFRDKLYHHTLPVRDGLWEAIEAQLPPKKEDRIFPVFWFTLFATTLLGGALMIGLFTPQENKPSTPASTSSNPMITSAITPDIKPSAVPGENAFDENHSTPGKPSSDHTNSASTPAAETLQSATSISANNSTDSKRTSTTKQTSSGKKPQRSQLATKASNALNPASTANLYPAPQAATETLAKSNADLSSGTLGPVGQRQSRTSSSIPMLDSGLTSEPAGIASAAFRPDPNCYKFGSIGSDFAFSADGFLGYGFSPKSYDDTSGESSIYINARKATESQQYTWNIGARLNLQHRSGFTARIGFTYTQAGDIFDYTDSLATQSTTRIDSFFAADGTFLYAETSQVLILGTLIKKIHNTYRYLDLPVIIGYELPMGRSTIMVNAGPVFNLTSSQSGEILDPMLHPRSITEGEPGAIDVYKNSLGIGLYLSAGLLFPIADHISGLVEPSLLYRLNPVTLNTYPLQEYRHHVNLNIGLRYHFN